MDIRIKGNLYSALGISIFGVNFVSMKYLVGYLPPFSIAFIRFFIATIFLYFLLKLPAFSSEKPISKKIPPKDSLNFAISGILGISIYYIFNTLALTYLTASLTSLICALIPFFTLLINVLVFKKPLKWFSIFVFFIALTGVYLVLDIPLHKLSSSSELRGIIYMLLAILSWIAYTFRTYSLQKNYKSMYLLYKQCFYGSLFLLFFALFDIPDFLIPFTQANLILPLILNLLFVGIICSALGYYYYVKGMHMIGVEIASFYMNLMPVITAIASFFILDEAITKKSIFGMILVLISLYARSIKDFYTKTGGEGDISFVPTKKHK